MRRVHAKAAVFLFLAVLLLSVLPTLAWSPSEDVAIPATVPEGSPSEETASGTNLQWVPSGSYPGFYAARDTRNLDPAQYNLVGGHQSFYWADLEPIEGVYRFNEIIEPFIEAERAMGKRAAFGILTFNGRANQHNPTNPAYRVPSWVTAAGNHHKIVCPDGFEIPRYWDATYKAKYRNFVQALANRYKRDPRVEFIQIGVGKFGESQPCDDADDACVKTALSADGLTEWSWAYIVNDITDIYADNFCFGPGCVKLLLPNAPTFGSDTCGRRTFTDRAIERGVGLFPAEMYPLPQWLDHRTHAGWNGCGVLDRILDQAGTDASWVPIAFEGYNYMTPDAITFFWGVAAALSRRADYITLERDVLYVGAAGDPVVTPIVANIATMGWAKQYLGKHINDTPSVWVLMRETGYKDNFYPQKGNYTFWLIQDDTMSQGRTVPTTYLPKSQIVIGSHWASYGEACVNPNVEVSQTFLRGTGDSGLKEGWICRRTDQASGNRYMWFKIDDRYRDARSGNEATITVTYLDRGTDSWRLEYDSTSGPKWTDPVAKGNTGRWRQAIFNLTDALLRNGVDGADFRLDCMADGNEYIHTVDARVGTPLPTATPTTTRSVTDTPTLSPTPGTATVTFTPSLTPNVTSAPRTITIKPGRADSYDTHIVAYEPTSNKSTSTRLILRSLETMTFRTLIRFDTSVIPSNSQVRSAKLYLYLDSYEHQTSTSPRVAVFKIQRDWVVSEATWNLAKSGEAWQVAGCGGTSDRSAAESGATVVSTNNTWYNWDITSLVGDWVTNPAGNRGMILISDAGRELRFYAADDPDTRYNPYLVVTYIEGGGTSTTPTPTGSPTNTPSVEPSPQITEKGASQDTYIDSENPTTNYENKFLHVRGLGYRRALLNFDVSDIPTGARIVSATLRLTADYQCNQNQDRPLAVGVYQVNKSWVANQATWNQAATGVPWASAGCEGVPLDRNATPASITTITEVSGAGSSQVKNYTWDVTSIVQSWVNSPSAQAGLVLMSQDAIFRYVCFPDSSYSLADRRPLLRIAWRYAPTPTSTPTSGTPTPTPTSSLGAIEGTVFEDMNLNGYRDAGEQGISGATVELWQGSTRISQQFTAGSGLYRFADLASGIYTVKEIDPAGYLSTTPNEVSGVVVMAGRTTSGIDFADYDPRVVTPPKLYLPVTFK